MTVETLMLLNISMSSHGEKNLKMPQPLESFNRSSWPR